MCNNTSGIIINTWKNKFTSKYINISMSYVILHVDYFFWFNIIIIFVVEGKILSKYIHIYTYALFHRTINRLFTRCPFADLASGFLYLAAWNTSLNSACMTFSYLDEEQTIYKGYLIKGGSLLSYEL